VQLVDQGEIVGFHPAISTIRSCDAFEALTKGDAFPGIVSDDTQLFHLAESQFMLPLQTISIRMPRSDYDRFVSLLDAERVAGKYSYGFPNGDGDCNCTTWLERLGLPLLTCHMEEFVSMRGFAVHAVRRFGACS
jgi:hypothetical protein